jgi:hypothetical protein
MIVILPNKAKLSQNAYESELGIWRSNKIIMGTAYPLYDINTIKKFNLKKIELVK